MGAKAWRWGCAWGVRKPGHPSLPGWGPAVEAGAQVREAGVGVKPWLTKEDFRGEDPSPPLPTVFGL